MEIKYKFANGEESYVEVSEEIGAAILESRRKEGNLNKKEYRQSAYSIDALLYEGEEIADKDTPENLLFNKEERLQVKEFFLSLTEIQRRRLKMRWTGMKISQIAKKEGADYTSVKETFTQIQKKFKTFFRNTPQI